MQAYYQLAVLFIRYNISGQLEESKALMGTPANAPTSRGGAMLQSISAPIIRYVSTPIKQEKLSAMLVIAMALFPLTPEKI